MFEDKRENDQRRSNVERRQLKEAIPDGFDRRIGGDRRSGADRRHSPNQD